MRIVKLRCPRCGSEELDANGLCFSCNDFKDWMKSGDGVESVSSDPQAISPAVEEAPDVDNALYDRLVEILLNEAGRYFHPDDMSVDGDAVLKAIIADRNLAYEQINILLQPDEAVAQARSENIPPAQPTGQDDLLEQARELERQEFENFRSEVINRIIREDGRGDYENDPHWQRDRKHILNAWRAGYKAANKVVQERVAAHSLTHCD